MATVTAPGTATTPDTHHDRADRPGPGADSDT